MSTPLPPVPPGPALAGYPYAARVPTRWIDNDVYGHVNNAVHYLAMDTVVNQWMIERGGLDVVGGPVIALVVESGCRYLASLGYPDALVLGLRIARLGRTSVQWEIGMTRESDGEPVAQGRFVHVFVDRLTRRPHEVPATLRELMAPLAVVADPAT